MSPDELIRSPCQEAMAATRGHVSEPLSLPRRPTREGCNCRASVDIGAYDTCPRGCVYCYANRSPEAGRDGAEAVDPRSPVLR